MGLANRYRQPATFDEQLRSALARERMEARGWSNLNPSASLDTLTRSWLAQSRGLPYLAPAAHRRGVLPKRPVPFANMRGVPQTLTHNPERFR
jgi:hypothetical protein